MEDQIAIITPSPVRRFTAVSIVLMLGFFIIYLAFSSPPDSILWQGFLLVAGVGAVMLGDKMRRATALSIILTKDAITDSSGRLICRLDDITSIDRGALAFKPANGFLLRTKSRLGRSWSPGLWWRFGHRIGVGGATPSGQGKMMAEVIAIRIDARERQGQR